MILSIKSSIIDKKYLLHYASNIKSGGGLIPLSHGINCDKSELPVDWPVDFAVVDFVVVFVLVDLELEDFVDFVLDDDFAGVDDFVAVFVVDFVLDFVLEDFELDFGGAFVVVFLPDDVELDDFELEDFELDDFELEDFDVSHDFELDFALADFAVVVAGLQASAASLYVNVKCNTKQTRSNIVIGCPNFIF